MPSAGTVERIFAPLRSETFFVGRGKSEAECSLCPIEAQSGGDPIRPGNCARILLWRIRGCESALSNRECGKKQPELIQAMKRGW